jgi:signal transduction histidine kinase
MQAVPRHDTHADTLPASEHGGTAVPGASRCLRGAPPLAPTAATRPERVLEAIVALGHVAGSDGSRGDYLDRVAAAICAALDYRVCVIYLYDRCDDTYYAEAMCGMDVAERHEVLATPVPMRVVERLMDAPYRLEHGYYVPASAPVWADPAVGVCFAMAASCAPDGAAWRPGDVFLMPLEADGKAPVGFLVIDEPVDGHLPGPETLRGLAALATSCANAVEKAHLYQIQNEEVSISSVLLQVSRAVGTPDQELLFSRTSSILASMLGADHCVVWHTDDGSRALCPVVAASDWAPCALTPGEVRDVGRDLQVAVARGEPIAVEQAGGNGAGALVKRLGLTSALLIPLFLHDALVGAITVGWTGPPHRFRVRELDIARGVSRLVGVALQNARLYRDVTRQAERNAMLYEREHEAVRRLQELDQLRSDFVSTVSHELRTPLTGIKGFTETLLSYWERMDEARRLEMVRKVNGSCRRLERLVQDLLLISRVESGVLPVRSTVTELVPLVEGAVREVEGTYRGQLIQVRPPAQPLIVLADADRVQQVLVNLLDNAAKYSPEGRPIRVRWNRTGQAVHVSVVDCGPGIDRAKFARLFTRFGKLDRHARAGHGGTGLGLYISKSLVEAMGGGIAVRSRPGWGSIFSFTLPLAEDS